ncbi:unnamed protein product, partial [Meganyctiphanes norvegica]
MRRDQMSSYRTLIGASLMIMFLMSMFLSGSSRSSTRSQPTFQARMMGPLDEDEQDLLDEVREMYLVKPSTLQYNLMETDYSDEGIEYRKYKSGSWEWYNKIIKKLFSGRPPGFYVEAGALDGEWISNTFFLHR